jgi:hypothetical protein
MTPKATATAGPEPGDSSLLELLRRAEQGDREVLPRLRVVLDQAGGVWRSYADLSAQLEGALIRTAAGENLLLQESLRRALAEKKQELMGEEATPLERLLIERVALGWLETHYLDLLEAQGSGLSSRQRAELRRRQDRASSARRRFPFPEDALVRFRHERYHHPHPLSGASWKSPTRRSCSPPSPSSARPGSSWAGSRPARRTSPASRCPRWNSPRPCSATRP